MRPRNKMQITTGTMFIFFKKGPTYLQKYKFENKKKSTKTYVWSIVHYDSEAYTIRKSEKKKLLTLETWCYKRLLK